MSLLLNLRLLIVCFALLRDLVTFEQLLNAKPHNANSMFSFLRWERGKTMAREKGQDDEWKGRQVTGTLTVPTFDEVWKFSRKAILCSLISRRTTCTCKRTIIGSLFYAVLVLSKNRVVCFCNFGQSVQLGMRNWYILFAFKVNVAQSRGLDLAINGSMDKK